MLVAKLILLLCLVHPSLATALKRWRNEETELEENDLKKLKDQSYIVSSDILFENYCSPKPISIHDLESYITFITENERILFVPFPIALESQFISKMFQWSSEQPKQIELYEFDFESVLLAVNCLEMMYESKSVCTHSEWSLEQLLKVLKVIDYLHVSVVYDALISRVKSIIVHTLSDADARALRDSIDPIINSVMKGEIWNMSKLKQLALFEAEPCQILQHATSIKVENTSDIPDFMKNSYCFSHLTYLDLSGLNSALIADTVIDLSLHFPKLKYLNLNGNFVVDEQVQRIAQCAYFSHLEHLDLGSDNFMTNKSITVRGAKALAESNYLLKLNSLNLSFQKISNEGVQYLVNAFPFKYLNLDSNKLNDRAVLFLTESSHLSQLETLILKSNFITSKGAEMLTSSLHLNELKYLDLSFNMIGNFGALMLVRCEQWRQLEYLALAENICLPSMVIEAVRDASFMKNVTLDLLELMNQTTLRL